MIQFLETSDVQIEMSRSLEPVSDYVFWLSSCPLWTSVSITSCKRETWSLEFCKFCKQFVWNSLFPCILLTSWKTGIGNYSVCSWHFQHNFLIPPERSFSDTPVYVHILEVFEVVSMKLEGEGFNSCQRSTEVRVLGLQLLNSFFDVLCSSVGYKPATYSRLQKISVKLCPTSPNGCLECSASPSDERQCEQAPHWKYCLPQFGTWGLLQRPQTLFSWFLVSLHFTLSPC